SSSARRCSTSWWTNEGPVERPSRGSEGRLAHRPHCVRPRPGPAAAERKLSPRGVRLRRSERMIQSAQGSRRPLWLTLLGLAALVLTIVGAYLALFASPPDVNQGDLIRIMYAHVPVAWSGFVAAGVSAVWGVLYLWRSRPIDGVRAVAVADAAVPLSLGAGLCGLCYVEP